MNIFGYDLYTCLIISFAISVVLVIGFCVLAFGALILYIKLSCGWFNAKTKMDGKTVIVTGATGGIGKETAKELAKRGARVIIACRNTERGNEVKEKIIAETNNQNVFVKELDLSSMESVRKFAADVIKTESKLHVLIHNAGTAETKLNITEDGFERTMATNHFGPFLLTHLLIDLLKKSGPSRIVVVASELYRFAGIDLNNVNPTNTRFPVYLYYVSKYANIYFSNELARRLEGTQVTANCLHPGMVDSGIWRNTPFIFKPAVWVVCKVFFKTPQAGCQTTLYAACDEELETVSGKYFMDCAKRRLSAGASDEQRAKKYWELTEKLVLKEGDKPI